MRVALLALALALAACGGATQPETLHCVWTDTLSTVGPWTLQAFYEGPKCEALLRDYPNKVRRSS